MGGISHRSADQRQRCCAGPDPCQRSHRDGWPFPLRAYRRHEGYYRAGKSELCAADEAVACRQWARNRYARQKGRGRNDKNCASGITGGPDAPAAACEILCKEISDDGNLCLLGRPGKRNVSVLRRQSNWPLGRAPDPDAKPASKPSGRSRRGPCSRKGR